MEYTLHLTYKINEKVKTATGSNEDFDVSINRGDSTLKVVLSPKAPISVLDFFVETKYNFMPESRFFANGYQSWTDSREFTSFDRMPDLGLIGKSIFGRVNGLKYMGDYTFARYDKRSGSFHSISFAYIRNGKEIDFFGSLTDRTGYTVIYADMNNDTLRFSKDLEGVVIDKPYDILDLYITKGSYDEVFDKYFYVLDIKPITTEKIKGYTSWYNYYQNINEEVILRDLKALNTQPDLVNTFQIDDGYQTAVGDWLSINKDKFPGGLKPIVDSIHLKGLQAGLWLAPFAAQKGSQLAKQHPDWLIKAPNGKPLCVGANWGGFYPLNIYNVDARLYIKQVFNHVLNVWGFDLVKLDFLYAACVVPMNGKTRGEIAYDSIELLRECVGDKKILACGVEQMPCFGKVEYMRIGADMALDWEHTLLRKNMHREDVSTPNAILNSVYRRCLNKRAFLCDPDVFLLRRTNIGFNPNQQELLAKFIKLFGEVLFTSDNIGEYNERQLSIFKDVMTDDDCRVIDINHVNDTLLIDYEQGGKADTLKFLVSTGEIF